MEVQENHDSILENISRDHLQGALSDVTDSQRYKEIERLPLPAYTMGSSIHRLTLQINIDGLEVAKSSASSLNPVMVIINELPPTSRQRNILVPFLFRKHGEVDFSDTLLKILKDDLNDLNQNGLQWWDPNGNAHRTQIISYCLCTDSMMKYKLLGIKSPSGYSSCPNCKEVGAYLYKGNGGSTCFPALLDEESNLIVAEPRTMDTFETGVNGQVNIPLLASLNNIGDKLFECTAIDQLHGVFGGNFKALIKRIFFSTSVPLVLRQKRLEHANSFMRSITPPSFMERGVRLLTDYKLWKGHEWREFFFYVMIPLLHSLVNEQLMRCNQARHLEKYIIAVSLLNGEQILPNDIDVAKDLLHEFVSQLDNFYEVGAWTHNMHLTLHLSDMVTYLGPLWSVSMFAYEGFSRTILNSFNGSCYVLEQIGARLGLRRSIYILHDKIKEIKPLSITLANGICKSKAVQNVLHSFRGNNQVSSKDRFHIAIWYNDVAISPASLNLQSCSHIVVGREKFGIGT